MKIYKLMFIIIKKDLPCLVIDPKNLKLGAQVHIRLDI